MAKGSRGRKSKPVCLEDEIDKFMEYIGLDDRMKEIKILEVWEQCVGKAIAVHSKPVAIKKHKLYVSVENAVWRMELSARKIEITQRLNASLGKRTLTDIVFV